VAELRIDVEARNARTQLNATARAVDQISDELVEAEVQASRLEGAFEDATHEVDRLRAQVERMGAAAPDALRRELYQAEVAAVRARQAFEEADHEIDRVAASLRLAEHEADRLERTLDRLDVDAGSTWSRMRRGALGFGDDVRDGSRRAMTGMREFIRDIPGELRTGLIGAGAILAVPLAAMVGAALNGAVLAGLGGGVLALGIKQAAADAQVASAFAPVGEAMKKTLSAGTESFKPKLVELAGIFQKSWQSVGPQVFNMFNELQHAIVPLGTGFARMFENMAPGLRQFLAASVPILKDFGRQLSMLGTNLGRAFQELARDPKTIEGAMRGLRMVMMLVSGTAVVLAQALGALSRWFVDVSNRAEVLFRALSHLPIVGGFFGDLADRMAQVNDGSSQMGRSLTGSAFNLGGYSAAAQQATNATMQLSQQMSSMFGVTMGVDQATMQWHQSVLSLTAALKENGTTTDQNTEKGLANAQAIAAAVTAAFQMRDASIAMAGGENASEEAINSANGALKAQLDQLAATMRQAGMTEDQIQALLGRYYAMANAPNIYKTITVEKKELGPQLGGNFGYRGFASGTRSAPAGMAWVGEEGPELVRFRGGERVHTAAASARMAATARNGGTGADGAYGGGTGIAPQSVHAQLSLAPGSDRAMASMIQLLINSGMLRVRTW
jgi:hypothetical protein